MIFRADRKKNAGKQSPKKTRRVPGSVPYVVDNLWEWKRPKEKACRRESAFASPRATSALRSGSSDSLLFKVEFVDPFSRHKLCQLIGYEDSKYHPECKGLKKILRDKLKQEWFTKASLETRKSVGYLWMPCLTKAEMDEIFTLSPLKEIKDDLYESISYWDDVVLVEDPDSLPDPEGELFFEFPDDYFLRPFDELSEGQS